MKRTALSLAAALLLTSACSRPQPAAEAKAPTPAQPDTPVAVPRPAEMEYEAPIVGGARIAPGNTLLASLAQSKEHTLLLQALASSGVDREISDGKPHTLFAPTDAAFRALPGGPERLLAPAGRERLRTLLRYHVVAGTLDAFELGQQVANGGGSAMLPTSEGGSLRATIGDGAALVVDANQGIARITVPNVVQADGVIHVVDRVLEPRAPRVPATR